MLAVSCHLPSADKLITFAVSLDPDHFVGPDLDQNCLTLRYVYNVSVPVRIFLKKFILKKKSTDDNKSMKTAKTLCQSYQMHVSIEPMSWGTWHGTKYVIIFLDKQVQMQQLVDEICQQNSNNGFDGN